jgi:hypothetical protein
VTDEVIRWHPSGQDGHGRTFVIGANVAAQLPVNTMAVVCEAEN